MRFILFITALLLVGCSSNHQATTYFIAQSPVGNLVQTNCQLSVESVKLASYLDRTGLVYQTSPHELVVAQQHLWAGDITEQIAIRVDSLLNQACFQQDKPLLLSVNFTEFYGRYTGSAVVGGQWFLTDIAGKQLTETRFYYEIPLPEEGYPALVDSLNMGLAMLVEDINIQLKQINFDKKI